jgi:Domain of unknown function (DUF4118)
MLGMLIIVLGRDPIARLEFSLGQRQVPVIVSSRVVRATWLWPRRTRCPPLRAASRYPSQSRLTRIHVCLSAILHGSLREIVFFGSTLAVAASFGSGLAAAYFIYPPQVSIRIDDPNHVAELGFILLLAITASKAVGVIIDGNPIGVPRRRP